MPRGGLHVSRRKDGGSLSWWVRYWSPGEAHAAPIPNVRGLALRRILGRWSGTSPPT